jgi:dephospho-CoA kinase
VDSILEVDNKYFARLLEERIESEEEADVIVVDGVRSLSDAMAVKRNKACSQLVFIQTPFRVRIDRIKSRGREGEEDIEESYLEERDRQELSWGVDEIMSSYSVNDGYSRRFDVEVFYANHDDTAEFRTEFDHFVDDLLEL